LLRKRIDKDRERRICDQGDSAELTNRVSESVMGDVARFARTSENGWKLKEAIEEAIE